MKKIGLLLAVCTVSLGVHAAESADSAQVEGDATKAIASLDQVEGIARETQEQFWRLVPPAEDPLYIHPDGVVRSVDWKSGEWPDGFLEQMVAQMGSVNGSMYPFYRLTVVETRSGELLWYNSLDRLVWKTPAPLGYNEYLFAFQAWDVTSAEELSAQQKLFGRSSNVGLELLLLPEAFMDSYREDSALEAEPAAPAEPMAMAMGAPASSTNLMMGIGVTESNEVEVGVYFPSGYTNPVDVFASTGLLAWDWSVFTNVSSVGVSNCTWIAAEATNFTTRFWVAARSDLDSDGDGLSDGYEKYLYQTDPNLADTDGDGIADGVEIANGTNPLYADSDGDGMGDAAELALTNSVAANGSGGVLVVVPDTGWYHATDPSLNLVYLGN